MHSLLLAVMISALGLVNAGREDATSVYLAIAIATALCLPLLVFPSPVREIGLLISGAVVACSGALMSIHLGFPVSEQGPSGQSMMSVVLFSLAVGFLALAWGRLQAMLEARVQARAVQVQLAKMRVKQDEILAALVALTPAERSER